MVKAVRVNDELRGALQQPRAALHETKPRAMQPRARRGAEALRQLIEPLHLLLQAHARMGALQPPLEALETRTIGAQLAPHATGEALRAARGPLDTRGALRP